MKKLTAIILAGVMVLGLAACGGTGGSTATTAAAATDAQTQAEESKVIVETEAVTEAADADESVIKDVINVGIEADVTNWNPWERGSSGRNDCLYSVYQPLWGINGLTGEFSNVIAKTCVASDDNMYYDVEIWDDVYDSEGNNITAKDVEFSYQQAATRSMTDVADCEFEITGDYTFKIKFTEDGGYRKIGVGELKRITVLIVSQAAYEASGDGMESYPVGTGAYILDADNTTSGYMMSFKANPDYWMLTNTDAITNIRDRQNVTTLNYYIIPEASQRTTALENGTIDMCSYISADDLDKFDGQNGFHIYGYPDNQSMQMWCNCDPVSPCNDENLRKAIFYAVSQEAVLASIYGGNGDVMYDMCPKWNAGYNTAWESQDNYYHYDLEKAKEYLEKSSYNGEDLVIICNTTANCVNTAQIIQGSLEAIGIKSNVQSYESSVYNDYITNPENWDVMVNTRPASAGNIPAGWESDMASYRWSFGKSINFVDDAEFQAKLSEVLVIETSTQENIDALHDYMVEHAYSKGLVNYYSFVVVKDDVADVALSIRKTTMPGGFTYTE